MPTKPSPFKSALLAEWLDAAPAAPPPTPDPWAAFTALLARMASPARAGQPAPQPTLAALTCALAAEALRAQSRSLRTAAILAAAEDSEDTEEEAVAATSHDIAAAAQHGMARMARTAASWLWDLARGLAGIAPPDLHRAWAALSDAAEGAIRRAHDGQPATTNAEAFLADVRRAAAEWQPLWAQTRPEWAAAFETATRHFLYEIGEVWADLTLHELTEGAQR